MDEENKTLEEIEQQFYTSNVEGHEEKGLVCSDILICKEETTVDEVTEL